MGTVAATPFISGSVSLLLHVIALKKSCSKCDCTVQDMKTRLIQDSFFWRGETLLERPPYNSIWIAKQQKSDNDVLNLQDMIDVQHLCMVFMTLGLHGHKLCTALFVFGVDSVFSRVH